MRNGVASLFIAFVTNLGYGARRTKVDYAHFLKQYYSSATKKVKPISSIATKSTIHGGGEHNLSDRLTIGSPQTYLPSLPPTIHGGGEDEA